MKKLFFFASITLGIVGATSFSRAASTPNSGLQGGYVIECEPGPSACYTIGDVIVYGRLVIKEV
jgi:hypothetical protein